MEFPMHWLIILVVVLILFGGRKIPELMHGLCEGVRGFKEGMHGASQSQSMPPTQTADPPGNAAEEERAEAGPGNVFAGGKAGIDRAGRSGGPFGSFPNCPTTAQCG